MMIRRATITAATAAHSLRDETRKTQRVRYANGPAVSLCGSGRCVSGARVVRWYYWPSNLAFGSLSSSEMIPPDVVAGITVVTPAAGQLGEDPELVRVYATAGGVAIAVMTDPSCWAPPIGSRGGTDDDPAKAAAPIGSRPSASSGVVVPAPVAVTR